MSTMIETLQGCNQEFFRTGEFPFNKGMSINISSTIHERKRPHRESVKFFLLDTLKTEFKIRNLIHR